MAVKCNIVGQVLGKLYALQYGGDCRKESNSIIENYIEYLNCSSVEVIPCQPQATDCSETIINFVCKIAITSLHIVSKEADTIVYGVTVSGGKAPYEYVWDFDDTDFTNGGPVNTNQSTLVVKAEKDLALLVSPISVTVTDADGCEATKSCVLNPTGLNCNSSVASCSNPTGLTVIDKITYCGVPSNLTVVNI